MVAAQRAPYRDVLGLVARGQPANPGDVVNRLQNLCAAAVRYLPASGAAVLVCSAASPAGVVAAFDPMSRALEEVQFITGEGPGLEACCVGRPTLEPDLAASGRGRWPAFASGALEQSVAAAFAFPLQVGSGCLGALDIYRIRPEPLAERTMALALTLGQAAVTILLDGQDDAADGDVDADVASALADRTEVYQAQGMVMVQLRGSLAEAMTQLRAHALAHHQSLHDVATQVLSGDLRFASHVL